MSSRRSGRWLRWGAILLVVALGIVVGVRMAVTSHRARSHRTPLGRPPTIASQPVRPDAAIRDDDLLATLRARLASDATGSDIAAALVDLGQRNPAKALDFAQWLARNPAERYELVAAVAGDWAGRDPAAAWRWVVATGTACDVPEATPLAAEVLARIAATDPNRAVTLVGSLLERDEGPRPLNVAVIADHALAAVLEHAGTDAAWRALREWSVAPAAELLGRDVFERVAMRELPAKAAAQLAALPASSGRNFALADVVAEWAAHDPRPALAWAQTLPAETGTDVSAAAFARWEANDPLAAAEWLAGTAPGRDNDRLIAHLVSDPRIVRSDVRAALSLAESVGEARLRCQCLESVVRHWAETDARAATEYVTKQAKLSADEKREILAALQPAPF